MLCISYMQYAPCASFLVLLLFISANYFLISGVSRLSQRHIHSSTQWFEAQRWDTCCVAQKMNEILCWFLHCILCAILQFAFDIVTTHYAACRSILHSIWLHFVPSIRRLVFSVALISKRYYSTGATTHTHTSKSLYHVKSYKYFTIIFSQSFNALCVKEVFLAACFGICNALALKWRLFVVVVSLYFLACPFFCSQWYSLVPNTFFCRLSLWLRLTI